MKAKTKVRDLQWYWLTSRATSVSIPIKFRSLLSLLHGTKNGSYLINCLELVEYAGDPNDIKMLATSQNEMGLQDVAYKLERVSLEKMLQLDNNSAKKGNKCKALTLGLGKRVRLYKQEIAKAKSLDSKKDHVPLMEWSVLRKLQMEKRPGTPEGNMSIFDCIWAKDKEAEDI